MIHLNKDTIELHVNIWIDEHSYMNETRAFNVIIIIIIIIMANMFQTRIHIILIENLINVNSIYSHDSTLVTNRKWSEFLNEINFDLSHQFSTFFCAHIEELFRMEIEWVVI